MSEESRQPRATPFSPLARAIMDSFAEAVVVFDNDGNVTYTNGPGRLLIESVGNGETAKAETLMPILARSGGRVAPLRAGSLTLGEAVYVPAQAGPASLADRERQAIVDTLDKTEWKLAETARVLGISRTTLWRRLKSYGLHRDQRGRWTDPPA